MEIIPIKKVVKNQNLLSLLESQFAEDTALGVERVDDVEYVGADPKEASWGKYRVYVRKKNGEWERDRFFIERTRRNGRIRELKIEGSFYYNQ